MKHKFKVSIPVAILITLISIIYQRGTGPTYPKRLSIQVEDGQGGSKKVWFKLPRSQENNAPAKIEVPAPSATATAEVLFRRFPLQEPYTHLPLVRENAHLVAELPIQPAAGKLEYFVVVHDGAKIQELASEKEPVVIRYKGPVPLFILVPHIFFMFFSMLLSSVVAVEAYYRTERYYPIALITTGCLMIGGMILGPFVQKYAFGVFWAGFPYGMDLTDNKLLIAVVAWLIAVGLNLKKRRPVAIICAAVTLVLVYTIPHSRMGSQFNYEKGEVQTTKKF